MEGEFLDHQVDTPETFHDSASIRAHHRDDHHAAGEETRSDAGEISKRHREPQFYRHQPSERGGFVAKRVSGSEGACGGRQSVSHRFGGSAQGLAVEGAHHERNGGCVSARRQPSVDQVHRTSIASSDQGGADAVYGLHH